MSESNSFVFVRFCICLGNNIILLLLNSVTDKNPPKKSLQHAEFYRGCHLECLGKLQPTCWHQGTNSPWSNKYSCLFWWQSGPMSRKSKNMGSVFNLSCSVAKCSIFRQLLTEKQYILKHASTLLSVTEQRHWRLSRKQLSALNTTCHWQRLYSPISISKLYFYANNINQLNGSETTLRQPYISLNF